MSNQNAAFLGSIPLEYDQFLGPIIFADYAKLMAERVSAHQPKRVLEMAAGTGIVTREIKNLLPDSSEFIATDLNVGMLDVARSKFASDEAIHFQPADAMSLPFDNQRFDMVVCQFGVMFFPDLEASLAEVKRVLQPGGRYLFSVWDSHQYNPFARITHSVAGSYFPHDPPGFYEVPFSLHKIDPVKTALLNTGFQDVKIHIDAIQKKVPLVANLARGIVHGNPLSIQIRERGGVEPDVLMAAITDALHKEFGPDPLTIPMQTICYETRIN